MNSVVCFHSGNRPFT